MWISRSRLALVLWGMAVLSAHAASPEADRLYQSALAKYAAKDYRGTIADAEGATKADPSHWQAWQLDGNARYAIGDTAGAVTVYRYALRIHPDNPGLKSFVDSIAPAEVKAPAAPASAAATGPANLSAAGAATPASTAPARPSEPGGLRAAVYGGYQMVSLDEFDTLFHEIYDETVDLWTKAGYPPEFDLTIPGGGVVAGLEATRPLAAGVPFGYGVRGDLLLVPDITSHFKGTTPTATTSQDYTLALRVIRVFVGGYARAMTIGPVRLRGDLWLGWMLLQVDWSLRETFTNTIAPSANYDTTGKMVLTGGGPAGSVEIGAALPLTARLEVFVKAGFTYSRAASAIADRDYDLDGDGVRDFKAGEGVVYDDDSFVPYDFTGAGGRAGLQYFF